MLLRGFFPPPLPFFVFVFLFLCGCFVCLLRTLALAFLCFEGSGGEESSVNHARLEKLQIPRSGGPTRNRV